ncbi:hypothetical protein NHN26_16880 [Rhodovulum tesquicola]|uniref:hypothetical protein n=1 Tax=Rhodovulum tesquicola TaxID=540254 RepID=UPI00209799DD|nr:hypothetical protein [Rhodovulum tesquicola]MCO8146880.1 hypothetical protein [Rhodovulum tesquicola]
MLFVKWAAWACFAAAVLCVVWAAGINAPDPLVFVVPLLVSGVLMLALDLALTRLTEIRDAILGRTAQPSQATSTAPNRNSAEEVDALGYRKPKTIQELQAAIDTLKNRT